MRKECNAENPDKCRFHGTHEYLRDNAQAAEKVFSTALSDHISSVPGSSAVNVERARRKQQDTRACFDAHDKEYTKLVTIINNYDAIRPEQANDRTGNWVRKSLTDRKKAADKIRTKLDRPLVSTNAEAIANPAKARVEKADAEYTSIQKQLDTYNTAHPSDTRKVLEAIAANKPIPKTPERQALSDKLDVAYKEQRAARRALNAEPSNQILDRDDPDFLKTLERKGYGKY